MILPTLLSARRRRCALAAIAVCLGSSIASVGPAQAAPATGAQGRAGSGRGPGRSGQAGRWSTAQ